MKNTFEFCVLIGFAVIIYNMTFPKENFMCKLVNSATMISLIAAAVSLTI